MSIKKILKIGNAQAFWGDTTEAAADLVRRVPDLDYVTLDYLSEVSLSIMAVQRSKDPQAGYARDFVDVVRSLIPYWKSGCRVKVVTNAGGLDPQRCAQACSKALEEAGLTTMKIGVVFGDDVLDQVKADPKDPQFCNLETGASIQTIFKEISTANAYLGSAGIVQALKLGADIVVTGRVADPSLTVGPCAAHFGWDLDDYPKIAQATVAGHLIECGTQVTGGISNRWLDLDNVDEIGFPVVEIDCDGNFTVTKPSGTGGCVSVETVKEQLLYEIGDPEHYKSPDVTVSFLGLEVVQAAENRVSVKGAIGSPPPRTYKVSATYSDGYKAESTLVIFGRNARAKAQRCGEVILSRMNRSGNAPERSCIECLGAGGSVPGIGANDEALECVLRVCVADHRRDVVEYFTRQMAPMVTAGPPGTGGYTGGRAHVRSVYGYWPCLIGDDRVFPKFEIIAVGRGR